MIVDDAAMVRLRLKELLEKAGHQVVAEAKTGIEAFEMFKEFKPDVVTMDITMPEMDGIEALKSIFGHTPTAKVVIISAVGQKKQIIEAIKIGAKEFLVKPFIPEDVVKAIKKVTNL